eukprot:365738-Chlamydomonas_euryale.AAC.23
MHVRVARCATRPRGGGAAAAAPVRSCLRVWRSGASGVGVGMLLFCPWAVGGLTHVVVLVVGDRMGSKL